MHLESIKLSGFKSFVEPVTLSLPNRFCAIVGPNGCGKSNIVDAVRWVTGESSAGYIRSDAMSSVIFNGSAARKPLGLASVELVFDNSDGALGGRYAEYEKLHIRREIDRDGESKYFLNGSRCLRRDIVDIFLGTGLGPRSYAIIEQGMINTLVEAKPDQLRRMLEEAAGISRYRERRRETESKIRRTRDNLARVDDMRAELDMRLRRLKQQVGEVERYRKRMASKRRLIAEIALMRHRERGAAREEIERKLRAAANEVEALNAEMEAAEGEALKLLETASARSDALNQAQAAFYERKADVKRAEEGLEMRGARSEELRARLQRLESERQAQAERMEKDQRNIDEWRKQAEILEAERAADGELEGAAGEALRAAEAALGESQQRWERCCEELTQARHGLEMLQVGEQALRAEGEQLRVRIEEMERELAEIGEVGDARQEEAAAASAAAAADEARRALSDAERELDKARAGMDGLRAAREGTMQRLEGLRARREAEAAMSEQVAKPSAEMDKWLKKRRVGASLAERLKVDEGWELAVEIALGARLAARGVDDLRTLAERLPERLDSGLALIAEGGDEAEAPEQSLARRVREPAAARRLLRDVIAVEDRAAALARWGDLRSGQSVISRCGLWLGEGWAQAPADSAAAVRIRQGLDRLQNEIDAATEEAEDADRQLEAAQREVRDAERRCAELREARAAADAAAIERRALGKQAAARLQRRGRLEENLAAARARKTEIAGAVAGRDDDRDEAKRRLEAAEREHEQCRELREPQAAEVEKRRAEFIAAGEKTGADALKVRELQTRCQAAEDAIARSREQADANERRKQSLSEELRENETPIEKLRSELKASLAAIDRDEKAVTAAREAVSETEGAQRETAKRRHEVDAKVEAARAAAQALELQRKDLDNELGNYQRQVEEQELSLQSAAEGLAEDADIEAWERKLQRLEARLERSQAVNLGADEEYRSETERKAHLDRQCEELNQTLEMLEGAIRKIDQETRQMFKAVFAKVNEGFGELFTRLFGGGAAHLELESEDWLNAGVMVMARPPGKRNTGIRQLSGGEKSLSAIALVFALFRANPAPLCVLDEVDAPLDDANTARFASLVKEISKHVQLICITHNKITMEVAEALVGVTMSEPGVSQVVGVELSEAEQMVATARKAG